VPAAAIPVAAWVARIVVAPAEALVATPLDPVALDTDAMAGADEDHVTAAVTSWSVPSVYLPVAVNASVLPRGIAAAAGVTSMLTSSAALTVRVVEPASEEAGSVAVIVAVPADAVLAYPGEVAFDTDATAGSEEDQWTAAVRSWVVPFV
jgi:hypothetical protein